MVSANVEVRMRLPRFLKFQVMTPASESDRLALPFHVYMTGPGIAVFVVPQGVATNEPERSGSRCVEGSSYRHSFSQQTPRTSLILVTRDRLHNRDCMRLLFLACAADSTVSIKLLFYYNCDT